MTGTYILQANRALFNQHAVNPTCQLCPETRQHFISECEFFTAERKAYRDRLSASRVITDKHIAQLYDPEFLTHSTLDASVILNVDDLEREAGVAGTVYQVIYIQNSREACRGP